MSANDSTSTVPASAATSSPKREPGTENTSSTAPFGAGVTRDESGDSLSNALLKTSLEGPPDDEHSASRVVLAGMLDLAKRSLEGLLYSARARHMHSSDKPLCNLQLHLLNLQDVTDPSLEADKVSQSKAALRETYRDTVHWVHSEAAEQLYTLHPAAGLTLLHLTDFSAAIISQDDGSHEEDLVTLDNGSTVLPLTPELCQLLSHTVSALLKQDEDAGDNYEARLRNLAISSQTTASQQFEGQRRLNAETTRNVQLTSALNAMKYDAAKKIAELTRRTSTLEEENAGLRSALEAALAD